MAGLLTLPADPVAAELRRWASEPFAWASDNCGLAVLGYVERCTGRRLAPAPRFANRAAVTRALRRMGGFAAYCDWAMAQLGCEPTDAPGRGDVALAQLPAGLSAVICLGSSTVAARGDRAVLIQPATPIAAWRVPCPRL